MKNSLSSDDVSIILNNDKELAAFKAWERSFKLNLREKLGNEYAAGLAIDTIEMIDFMPSSSGSGYEIPVLYKIENNLDFAIFRIPEINGDTYQEKLNDINSKIKSATRSKLRKTEINIRLDEIVDDLVAFKNLQNILPDAQLSKALQSQAQISSMQAFVSSVLSKSNREKFFKTVFFCNINDDLHLCSYSFDFWSDSGATDAEVYSALKNEPDKIVGTTEHIFYKFSDNANGFLALKERE